MSCSRHFVFLFILPQAIMNFFPICTHAGNRHVLLRNWEVRLTTKLLKIDVGIKKGPGKLMLSGS